MSMEQHDSLIEINVEQTLASRLGGRRMSRIPAFAVRWLERFVRQDRLNQLLRAAWPATGADFCARVLTELDVTYDVVNAGRLPAPGPDSRVLFVSNHPLGGLDGMILIDMLTRRCCTPATELRFVVNDLLGAVKPLDGVFVPVNKHGRQSREAVLRVEEAFDGPGPVVMFPAGLCSRRDSHGRVRDLDWNPMFVKKAMRSGRDIVPIHFDGVNSQFFYRFAALRKLLGIKFNLEMTRLPAEVVNSAGRRYTITVGERLECPARDTDVKAEAARIRNLIYQLT